MMNRVLILCAALLGSSVFIAWASRPEAVPPREALASLPLQIGDWQGRPGAEFSDRIMAVLGVDDYVNRLYNAPGGTPLSLYVGYYKSQRQGSSIHSPLNCLPGAGWNPVKREKLIIPAGETAIETNRIVILKGITKQVVLYWYQAHGRTVASEYKAKIYTVLDAMRTGRTDAALVRIVSPTASLEPAAEEAASRRAIEFARRLYPLLDRYIPE